MRLLLDTHFALWVALERSNLSIGERAFLSIPGTELIASVLSLWELRLKWDRLHPSGERKGPADPNDVLRGLEEAGVSLLLLTERHAVAALTVALSHNDPFDERLLVQAQEEDLRLLTRDAKLIGHPLAIAA